MEGKLASKSKYLRIVASSMPAIMKRGEAGRMLPPLNCLTPPLLLLLALTSEVGEISRLNALDGSEPEA
ncbi:uncharacterized [Tachysurus ichikawai]